jgi:hypothetical protein
MAGRATGQVSKALDLLPRAGHEDVKRGTMRRLLTVCAALVLTAAALTLISIDTPTRVRGQTPSPSPAPAVDPETFRSQLSTYVSGMQAAVTAAKQVPQINAAFQAANTDPSAGLAQAQQQVPQLSTDVLTAMQQALANNPNWQQQPAALQNAIKSATSGTSAGILPPISGLPRAATYAKARVEPAVLLSLASTAGSGGAAGSGHGTLNFPGIALGASGASVDPAMPDNYGGLTTDCSSSWGPAGDIGGTRGEFYGAFAALQIANGLQAAINAFPSSDFYQPGLLALSILWGVAQETAVGLQAAQGSSYDCVGSELTWELQSIFPPTADSPPFVRISSQASIDALKQTADSIDTQVGAVNTTVSAVDTKVNTATTDLTNLTSTVNTINTTTSTINGQADTLTTNLATLQTTENTISGKADTAISNLTSFQQLKVQANIEAALSQNGNAPIALFQVPSKVGGYLDATPVGVQSIVTNTLKNEQAAGKDITIAQSYLSQANAALAAGQYKAAYTFYAQAYQAATQ